MTLKEAKELLNTVVAGVKDFDDAEVVICPPFAFLSSLINSSISFGAQDCYSEDKGSFTGEISALMLEDLGCKYVILGHSERRNIFNETNEEINLKLKKVLNSNIIPIICIGENKEDREEGKTFEVLAEQLDGCLENISKEKAKKIILAYEPVWAIGTGKFAEISKIEEVRNFIQEFLSKKFSKDVSENIKIIYGGSVDSKNVYSYLSEAMMDGVLVGGASLKANEFLELIKSAKAERV
ncbi:MAG: triose-phosphate isomerase [Candidatus Pacebacteria bacterium]|nr:triose-phosphate isomerase [Candidatus Paceibacterota bacterium]